MVTMNAATKPKIADAAIQSVQRSGRRRRKAISRPRPKPAASPMAVMASRLGRLARTGKLAGSRISRFVATAARACSDEGAGGVTLDLGTSKKCWTSFGASPRGELAADIRRRDVSTLALVNFANRARTTACAFRGSEDS